MMGDRNYQKLIKDAINSIGRELDIEIDADDINMIHLSEAVQCLRRSYFDRIEPEEEKGEKFNDLVSGLLRKMNYGAETKDFEMDGIKLRCRADMMLDDAIILFRSASKPPQNPSARDLLYLNACMWAYGAMDGILVYITSDRQEVSFSLTKNKKMFEQTARRVRVLHNLLGEKKAPILEPSGDCTSCQYYGKCYVKERIGRPISLMSMMGFDREKS